MSALHPNGFLSPNIMMATWQAFPKYVFKKWAGEKRGKEEKQVARLHPQGEESACHLSVACIAAVHLLSFSVSSSMTSIYSLTLPGFLCLNLVSFLTEQTQVLQFPDPSEGGSCSVLLEFFHQRSKGD